MQRDIERVQEIYDSFQRRKLPALLSLTAPDIEVIQSPELPWGGNYSGHEGMKQFLTQLLEHLDSRVEIERFIDAGDRVVAVGRTVGKARATGLEFDIPFVHVWTVREGRFVRFESYLDNATLLAALRM
jgi:ketosteroid isomerase-like protein